MVSRQGGESGRRIGVVIPARDEEVSVGACIRSLEPFLNAGEPVLVVDAMSRDATAVIAEKLGARVIRGSEAARGHALARGYDALAGEVEAVLFIHADMIVRHETRERILSALDTHPEAVGGALGHRIDDPRTRFRWIEAGNRFRARRWQIPYGDQAQFVRTAVLATAGGFPMMPTMEDLEMALRLRRLGVWLYLDCPVDIPARHWKKGVVRTTLRNWLRASVHRLRREDPPIPELHEGAEPDRSKKSSPQNS